jgi:NADH dehydrogenase
MEIVIIEEDRRIKPAKELLNEKGITVTLVDKNNYNFFALNLSSGTAFWNRPALVILSKNFRVKKSKIRLGNLLKVNPLENTIILHNGELNTIFGFATGAETSYFGMENVKKMLFQ